LISLLLNENLLLGCWFSSIFLTCVISDHIYMNARIKKSKANTRQIASFEMSS